MYLQITTGFVKEPFPGWFKVSFFIPYSWRSLNLRNAHLTVSEGSQRIARSLSFFKLLEVQQKNKSPPFSFKVHLQHVLQVSFESFKVEPHTLLLNMFFWWYGKPNRLNLQKMKHLWIYLQKSFSSSFLALTVCHNGATAGNGPSKIGSFGESVILFDRMVSSKRKVFGRISTSGVQGIFTIGKNDTP